MADLPFLPFLFGAALLPLLGPRGQRALSLAIPALAAGQLWRITTGDAFALDVFGYELVLLRVDALSLAFAYVFVGMALLAGLYGLALMDGVQRTSAMVYAGSSIGVVFAGDLITLFVFWELMAVASTMLVWARRSPVAHRAGMRYLQVHLTGGAVLLAGILLHLADGGSLAFEAFTLRPATGLILAAFALNAAVPPLHAWLTDAYPEATVAGAVFLSAFTTKVAVYALARGFPGTELLVWFGVAMALYGVVYAVLENDIRRLLAYHIVSQVGYMVAAVGIGTSAAISGATAHAFAHILYKGLLFMGAGAVLQATGRSKLTELGGLYRAMPVAFGLYMVGAFSISSVPLFSGFVSKELLLHAASLDGRDTLILLLKLASVGTFLHTGLKLPYFTWFGPRRDLRVAPIPRSMYVAMGLTALVNVVIGVVPGAFFRLLPFPVDYSPYTATHVVELLQLLTFTGLGFWLLVRKVAGEPTITLDTDWLYRRPAGTVRRSAVDGTAAVLAGIDNGLERAVRGGGGIALGRAVRRAPATWALGLAIMLAVGLLLGASLR